ncbi:MAG: hypothetical protein WC058_06700 [Phycisphaeraceae bacterium]
MLASTFPIFVILLTLALAWPLGRYLRWAMDPTPGSNPGPRRGHYESICDRILGMLFRVQADVRVPRPARRALHESGRQGTAFRPGSRTDVDGLNDHHVQRFGL